MGKQYDKVIKRRRRAAYLERKKSKAKEAANASKSRVRKPAVRKAPAAKASEPATTPETTTAAAPEETAAE